MKALQYAWQRVQLRLVATWESYTRSMSKQIRWKEAGGGQAGEETSSLWAVSRNQVFSPLLKIL